MHVFKEIGIRDVGGHLTYGLRHRLSPALQMDRQGLGRSSCKDCLG